MPFHFINNNDTIDRKARKLIRSHAAKGKNLGRTIHRPSRDPRPRKDENRPVGTLPTTPPIEVDECEDGTPSFAIQRYFQEDLAVSLPFEVNPTSRRLFHQVVTFMKIVPYGPQISKFVIIPEGPNQFLQVAFVDEAFFHTVVAMAVASSIETTRQETAEALSHLSRSLQLVNKRLAEARDVAISDTTLAVIIALTQHERLLGYYHQGLVHFEGLLKLLDTRGGISALVTRNPKIASKAFRADLDFALQFGTPTRFNADDVPGGIALFWLKEERRELQETRPSLPTVLSSVSDGLRQVYEDISTLVWLVNENAVNQIKIDDHDFHSVLLLILYRLFRVRSINAAFGTCSAVEVVLHLGLTAVMTEFFFSSRLKLPDVRALNKRIYSAVHDHSFTVRDEQELLFWILCTCKTSVFNDPNDDIWLIPKASEVMRQLVLGSWEDASQILQKYPWINIFSDAAGKSLWDQVTFGA
ncbi:hypothetical protein F5Y18DRAFT_441954 [Xylariaceae sp. FL1019]|nr:hypothetical protein F5Y18DRAFT_441954 [Xylariaceae sp. FL1019]